MCGKSARRANQNWLHSVSHWQKSGVRVQMEQYTSQIALIYYEIIAFHL